MERQHFIVGAGWQSTDQFGIIASFRYRGWGDTSLSDMLSAFYARSEQNASDVVMPALTTPGTPVPPITAADVRLVFLGVNPRKAMCPDSVPDRALRACADQLAEEFTDIFKLSLL